jgi:hypothetical protein
MRMGELKRGGQGKKYFAEKMIWMNMIRAMR